MKPTNEFVPASLPPNEEERLDAVQWSCLLDTPPEPMFDDLTALAATLFEVPTVLISIIDRHRQYFKSIVGSGLRETSRRCSFCAHALLSDAPLIVPDALMDNRFHSNPLVLGEPYIRFYAGAPLLGKGGHKLGTFCIIDTNPRYDFTADRYLELQRFATLTSNLIQQRLAERDLHSADERSLLAAGTDTDAIEDLDYPRSELHTSVRSGSMLGLPAGETHGRLEERTERHAGYSRVEQMPKDADLPMYRAKLHGKAASAISFEKMREDTRAHFQLEAELRKALERNEFEVWYQPKIRLCTGAIKGFEALVRWRHPTRGLVSPMEFIPVAEEIGLITDLGRWVAIRAISQLAEWHADGLVDASVTMAVNVSPRQFEDADLLPFLSRQLRAFEVPPSCLVVEVTEGVLVEDTDASRLLLQSIVDAGMGLDLDDFGTGYSSLSYLHRFPFCGVKIDRSFVGRMSTDPESVALVASIVALAKSLHMGVIAEGVENEEQARHLRQMGCNAAQGYLFSPPRPAGEIVRYLRERVKPLPAEARAELLAFPQPEPESPGTIERLLHSIAAS